jgi:ectoine hydroxylase-related dioxygenase (phytanoyl-CoA dioxygenase family)
MSISPADLERYRRAGHVTLAGIFEPAEMDAAIADTVAWADAFVADLDAAERQWYLEETDGGVAAVRKLDNPHHHRPTFRRLAADQRLLDVVEQIIGKGVTVYFSQIFFKPPHGGGPKPVHQDNFYFGPSDLDGLITVWIALDAATVKNGCLQFADGSHRGPVLAHEAPADSPFNLQIPAAVADWHAMRPAPVPKGGISLHHGTTLHQSSDNRSADWRRACALHYVRNDNPFVTPALPYDRAMALQVSGH